MTTRRRKRREAKRKWREAKQEEAQALDPKWETDSSTAARELALFKYRQAKRYEEESEAAMMRDKLRSRSYPYWIVEPEPQYPHDKDVPFCSFSGRLVLQFPPAAEILGFYKPRKQYVLGSFEYRSNAYCMKMIASVSFCPSGSSRQKAGVMTATSKLQSGSPLLIAGSISSSERVGQERELPGELWDIVIDELADLGLSTHFATTFDGLFTYHRYLRSSALTCKMWIPRSYFHQFRDVHLNHFNYDSFIRACRSSPHILNRVRHLNIFGQVGGAVMLHRLATSLPLHSMVSLSAVTLQSFQSLSDAPRFYKAVSQFRTVDTLYLCDVSFESTRKLSLLISAFPNVTRTIITFNSPYGVLIPSTTGADDILCGHHPTCAPLSLWIDGKNQSISPVNRLLAWYGPTLTDLRLDVRQTEDQDISALSLIHNIQLQDLALVGVYEESCKHVADIVSTISSTHLRHLRLELWPGAPSETEWCLNQNDWDKLSDILDRESFFSLAEVQIVFLTENCKQIQVDYEKLLPTLHRRGIVACIQQCVWHRKVRTPAPLTEKMKIEKLKYNIAIAKQLK